jgi:Uma2 family endonuclease
MDIQQDYAQNLISLFPQQGEWREEDYFALPDSNRIIELSEGELIVSPPPSTAHQRAVRKLSFALDAFIQAGGHGEVFFAPFAVRLREGKIREPDVLFISAAHADRVTAQMVDGAPDWVAEVISPGSRVIDEVEKLADYAAAGVPEYWLVDLEARTIRVYALADAKYTLAGTYGAGETARSETLGGFEIPVDDVIGGPDN